MALLSKSTDHVCLGVFWELSSLPLIFISVVLPVAPCLNYYSVIIGLKSGCLSPSNLLFFFELHQVEAKIIDLKPILFLIETFEAMHFPSSAS